MKIQRNLYIHEHNHKSMVVKKIERQRERERERERKKERKKGMELEHFSHDHPLILYTEHMGDDVDDGGGVKISCYACEQLIISGQSYYGCNWCWFFLHKSCAELPKEITHPSHLEHPLTLLSNPPPNYEECICDVCRKSCNRFVYHCSPCKFDVDLKCSLIVHSIQQRIEHKSHTHHRLISLQKPAMFFCDACGTKHEGTSYLCITCGFWVNQNCANSLPNTIKLTNHSHPHPLTLIYSIPFESYRSSPICAICHERVYRRNWVYYCSNSECIYFVHVNCATSETEHYMDCKSEAELKDLDLNLVDSGITTSNTKVSRDCKADTKAGVLVPNFITLPAPNESIDLMAQFIKGMTLQGKYKGVTEIQHVSHGHPLFFFDKQIDGELCSRSKLPLLNEVTKNDEKCNGCAQTISAPFFYCAECHFFLHEWCAELPIELRHSCHPEHPLLLIPNIHLFRCRCCKLDSNMFIFCCFACGFFLDCKCASIPRIIRHEAHEHTLALRRRWSGSCGACNYVDDGFRFAFVCDPCNLNICVGCALLPGMVSHRYDEHPFTLTYSPPPLKDQVIDEEYICEICEEEINPKLWFYHCDICDQSLHTRCIRPIDRNSNMKYGVTIKLVDYHPHLLTFVQRPKDVSVTESPCGRCGQCFLSNPFVYYYECAPCNFWTHFYCVGRIVGIET